MKALLGEQPSVAYDHDVLGESAVFVRVCPHCCRFVKADDTLPTKVNGDFDSERPNATCSRCGRVAMEFEGWYSAEDFDE